jgi:adenosylhomocysteine nucleosidase
MIMHARAALGIIMATKIEADPFIKKLSLSVTGKKPFSVSKNEEIILIISGIGKSNAAAAAAHLITVYRPDRVFNLGAAGSVSGELGIGEIIHARKIIEPDRPRLFSSRPVMHRPDVIKGFHTAVLATQDRPVFSAEERKAVGRYADCADMEGAAVAQVCRAYGCRVYLFKIITDTPESRIPDIVPNIMAAREPLAKFFIEKVMPAAEK